MEQLSAAPSILGLCEHEIQNSTSSDSNTTTLYLNTYSLLDWIQALLLFGQGLIMIMFQSKTHSLYKMTLNLMAASTYSETLPDFTNPVKVRNKIYLVQDRKQSWLGQKYNSFIYLYMDTIFLICLQLLPEHHDGHIVENNVFQS